MAKNIKKLEYEAYKPCIRKQTRKKKVSEQYEASQTINHNILQCHFNVVKNKISQQ